MATSSNFHFSLNETIKHDIKINGKKNFNSKEKHFSNAFKNFRKYFNSKSFCDLELIAAIDEAKISVHRLVLAASSRFFRDLFLTKPKKRQLELNIDGETLTLLVNFCYTGEILMDSENLEHLIALAFQFDFDEIKEMCSDVLKTGLVANPRNSLIYNSLACCCGFDELETLSKQFMLKHFMDIKDAEEFLTMDFDQLFQLMQSSELVAMNEEDVLSAALKWINYDKAERKSYIEAILKTMRYDAIDVTFLVKNVTEIMTSASLTDDYKEILNYKYNANLKPEWLLENRKSFALTKINEFRISVVACDKRFLMPKREVYNSTKGSWVTLKPFNPSVADPIHAIIQWRDSFFVSGGQGSLVQFDLKLMENSCCLKVPIRCEKSALIVHHECLYILAGNLYNPKTFAYDLPTKMVQIYDIKNRKWTRSEIFTEAKSSPIATFLDNRLICTDRDQRLVECIDMTTNQRNTLQLPDEIAQMTSHSGKLYVACKRSIHQYNFSSDTWTKVIDCEICIISKTIHSNEIVRVSHKSNGGTEIFKYCCENNKWMSCGVLQAEYSISSSFFIFFNYDI